jgi:hypothetical protein
MPYSLNNFDGRAFTVLDDGVVDRQASSSLYLIGKSVTGYGTFQNDNFLWLLENFAGTVEPTNKLQGQLWFDKTIGVMKPKVYDGTGWRPLSMMSVSNSTPTTPTVGDFWFNDTTDQLYIKNSTSTFLVVGRETVPGYDTTRMASMEVLDTGSAGHACIVVYADGDIIGAISTDEFDVKSTESVYAAGIIRISRGFNFISGAGVTEDKVYAQQSINETITGQWNFTNGFTISNAQVYTSSNDLVLDNAGNDVILSGNNVLPVGNSTILGSSTAKFAKIYAAELTGGTSISPVTLTGQFSLGTSSKLTPGSDNVLLLGAANARWASVFTAALSAGGTTSPGTLIGNWALDPGSSLDLSQGTFVTDTLSTGDAGTAGTLTGNWTLSSDSNLNFTVGNLVMGTGYIDATLGTLKSTTLTTDSASTDGNITGNWKLTADSTIDATLGTLKSTTLTTTNSATEGEITGKWKLTSGSTLESTYADIAERYTSDEQYDPGTVVMFGGTAEVTIGSGFANEKAAGIVTTNPAQTLNSELENSVAIALVGRVPCKVVGRIYKGDMLTVSDTPGAATRLTHPRIGALIGKALEDYNSNQVGVIEVMVYRG